MLRAFDELARTLNLSDAAERLGVTRQTVRRHISELEALRGGPLFSLQKQAYTLTDRGRASLAGARSMLRQANRWSESAATHASEFQHLDYAKFVAADGSKFLCQQHPVSTVSRSGTALVTRTLRAWGAALAQIEDPNLVAMRPYLALYRRNFDGWVCISVGEKSTYARWFGWTWAKSAVGQLSEHDRAGADYNGFIADAYDRIHGEGGVRFDHNFAHLPRETANRPVPVTFQRLLMGCVFPDGAPALAVLTSVTPHVIIEDFGPGDQKTVSSALLSEFQDPMEQILDRADDGKDDSIHN